MNKVTNKAVLPPRNNSELFRLELIHLRSCCTEGQGSIQGPWKVQYEHKLLLLYLHMHMNIIIVVLMVHSVPCKELYCFFRYNYRFSRESPNLSPEAFDCFQYYNSHFTVFPSVHADRIATKAYVCPLSVTVGWMPLTNACMRVHVRSRATPPSPTPPSSLYIPYAQLSFHLTRTAGPPPPPSIP